MSSVKKWVVGAAACVVACGALDASAQNVPTVVVDKQLQAVQSPTLPGRAGISYQQTGSGTSALNVYTKGFLFCGNIGTAIATPATLTLAHESQSLSPVHNWAFPSVIDIATFGYSGSVLTVLGNDTEDSPLTLTCHSTSDVGAVTSGLREGIFDDSYDSATQTNYGHLVNWIPPRDFSWSDPDWTQVPTDACNPTAEQPFKVAEDIACAAVTGVKPHTSGGDEVRAPIMWTASDGTSFTYLFRFDGRQGPQTAGAQAVFDAPQATQPGEPADTNFPKILIQDAYDHTYLSASGQYCILYDLPTALNSSTCASTTSYPLDDSGFLHLPITLGALPVGSGIDQAFYVAVTRPISGAPSTSTVPVVAVSVLMEPDVTEAGGDNFSGDDVVFGFMPTSSGFPWMSGQ
ncbi:MAG TPA: hypothetical protein VGC30_03015 [Dokdonella sp.]